MRKFLLTLQTLGLILQIGLLQACSPASPAPAAPGTPTASLSIGIAAPSVPSATETATASPSPTRLPPPLPVVDVPDLVRIEFQDENNGWGIATNENGSIVRTVDGGSTWLNASPPGMGGIGTSAVLSILDPESVWVLAAGTDFFAGSLYRTTDGGLSWTSNPVPFGGALIQFQDQSNGKALAERGATGGSEAIELFQTSDGGTTWVSTYHNDPSQPGATESLPLEGIKNGMTFLDANTGWVTGSSPAAGEVYLYITQDGGTNWSQQKLPLSTGYATDQVMAQTPIFFGKNGYLPVRVYLADKVSLTFFHSQDSGLTWTGDAGDATQSIQPGMTAIADAQHLWSWNGGPEMYLSTDSAKTWKTIKPNLNLSGRLSQMQVVPAAAGHYTGWALTRTDEAGHSQLYRTKDGIIWTLLTH